MFQCQKPLLRHIRLSFKSRNLLLVTQCIVCHKKQETGYEHVLRAKNNENADQLTGERTVQARSDFVTQNLVLYEEPTKKMVHAKLTLDSLFSLPYFLLTFPHTLAPFSLS